MPRKKTELQRAAGKLVSVIQKEWGNELGESHAEISENVMSQAHALLQSGSADAIKTLLSGKTLRQYIGEVWIQEHPRVKPAILALESLLIDVEQDRSGRGCED